MTNKKSGLSRIWSSFKNLIIRVVGFGKAKQGIDTLREEELMSPTKQILKKFIRNRIAIVGFVMFFSILIFIVVGSRVIDFRPAYQENSQQFLPPGLNYLNVPSRLKKEGVKSVVTPLGEEQYLIGSGVAFTVAISNANKIYVWGANIKGIRDIPEEITSRVDEIVQMSVGSNHVVVLMENREMLGWGHNNFEQAQAPIYDERVDLAFGQFKKTIEAYFYPEARLKYPDEVRTIQENDPIVKVAAGYDYTAILTESGAVYSWGNTKGTNVSEGRYSFDYFSVQLRTIANPYYSSSDVTRQPTWDLQWKYANRLTWNTFYEHQDVINDFGLVEVPNFNIALRVYEDNAQWQYVPQVFEFEELEKVNDILDINTQITAGGLQLQYLGGAWIDAFSHQELIDKYNIFVMPGVNVLFRINRENILDANDNIIDYNDYLQWSYDHSVLGEWRNLANVLQTLGFQYRIEDNNLEIKYLENDWNELISESDLIARYALPEITEIPITFRFLGDKLEWIYDTRNVFSDHAFTTKNEILNLETQLTAAGLEWRFDNRAWTLLYDYDQLIDRYRIVEKDGVDILFRINNGRLEWKYDEAEANWTAVAEAVSLIDISIRIRNNEVQVYNSDTQEYELFLSFNDVVARYNLPVSTIYDMQLSMIGTNLRWSYENQWTFLYAGDDFREDLTPVTYNKIVNISAFEFNVVYFLEDNKIEIVGLSSIATTRKPSIIGWSSADRGYEIISVVMTKANMFALTNNGNIISWGEDNSENRINNIPEEVEDAFITRIAAGMYHVVALSDQGEVFTWGNRNDLNQLNIPRNLTESIHITAKYFNSYSIGENGSISGWGNRGYVFGTDFIGADLFKRVIAGGSTTMYVAAIAVVVSLIIGLLVGLTAGFYGKWVDNLLMRFGEIVGAFPFLPLAMTLAKLVDEFGMGERERIIMIMIILGLLSWPGLARLVRGQILSERERDFVMAAKALGIKERHIITRHILPNVINVVIVSTTLSYAGALLTESGLSFLGFGVRYPMPSWGNMLTSAQSMTVLRNYWWLWIIPAFFIIGTALSINLVGDGLRDAMDPKSNER